MNNKAQVLVIILWILGFLSVAAFSLSRRTATELKVVKYRLEEINARAAAKSAIVLAKAIISDDKNTYGALNETWSNGYDAKTGRYLFKQVALGKTKFDISYIAGDKDNAETCYGLEDEESKLNINTAGTLPLTALLEEAALAQAIMDFRQAQNKDFFSLEQLLLVKGMDRKIFDRIKPAITCFGAGKVNLNTAPRQVLGSLGISDVLADKIELFRKGPDKKIGTSDDGVLKNKDEILTVLSAAAKLTIEEQQLLGSLAGEEKVDVVSTAFTARIGVTLTPGERPKMFECVIGRVGEEFNVFYWQG